jgi:hypothetical protein
MRLVVYLLFIFIYDILHHWLLNSNMVYSYPYRGLFFQYQSHKPYIWHEGTNESHHG